MRKCAKDAPPHPQAVFSDAFWPMYHKILRSDYTMFDEYVYAAQDTRAPVRLVAQWATEDTRITKDLVEGECGRCEWISTLSGPSDRCRSERG